MVLDIQYDCFMVQNKISKDLASGSSRRILQTTNMANTYFDLVNKEVEHLKALRDSNSPDNNPAIYLSKL